MLFHEASNVTAFMVNVSVILQSSDVLLSSLVPRENVSKLPFLFVCRTVEADAGYPTIASHWKKSRYRVTSPATNVFGVALNIGVVGVPGIKQSTGSIISEIYYKCESLIEKSVTRITDWHHLACRVMTNSDHEGQIFLSHLHTNNVLFFLLITKYLILYDKIQENPENVEMRHGDIILTLQ